MKAYVVINRPEQCSRTAFVLYVAMAGSPEEALAAAKAKFGLNGNSEVNGAPMSDQTARAMALLPGEVRAM